MLFDVKWGGLSDVEKLTGVRTSIVAKKLGNASGVKGRRKMDVEWKRKK